MRTWKMRRQTLGEPELPDYERQNQRKEKKFSKREP